MSSNLDFEASDGILISSEDVRDFNSENLLPLPAEDLIKIREWLQPTPYDQEKCEFSRHLASHLVGTGKWLTSTTVYQQWHQNEDNGMLWIKGIPGSGKSVMAASIIDQLRKEEVPVLYFFFRQIIDANHRPVAVLRDWLCQFLPYSPALQLKLLEKKSKNRSLHSLSLSDLWEHLKFALASFPKVYCVTDALDEMDQGNDDFLRALVNFSQWRPANVKVLITSRPVVTVEAPLRTFSIPHIRLEERVVDLDISAYVQYRLRNSSIQPEYQELIIEAIPGRANGLFLCAKISMDAFLEPGTDARKVLEALPADLNRMYDDLLREHAKRSNVPDELQLLVLQFVIYATSPLRLLQIADMVNTVYISNAEQSLKTTKDLVRAACGPLLEILPDETVSVVHHSFTEFLKGFTRSISSRFTYPVLQSGLTNQRLAVACLDYLASGCLYNLKTPEVVHRGISYDLRQEKSRRIELRFPFLDYAAHNWYVHASRAALAGVDMSRYHDALDTFFGDKKQRRAWLSVTRRGAQKHVNPLHIAAQTGLAQYSAHLLRKGDIDVNKKTSSGTTPLFIAAQLNHVDIVRALLENGADPDANDMNGLKPLHEAAERRNVEVVKLLLAAGVDPLTPKTKETRDPRRHRGMLTAVGATPFMYACKTGHVETVSEFLPYLKSIEIFSQALSWAAESGHAALSELILRHSGVGVNEHMEDGTALFKACKSGNYKAIEVLLQEGADPNKYSSNSGWTFPGLEPSKKTDILQEQRGYTALHALCGAYRQHHIEGTLKGLELLLKAGAEVNLKAFDGSTALHLACYLMNIDLIKPLMEAGADPSMETDSGATVLHTNGATDKELLPLFMETGRVDINKALKETGKRPLHFRLSGGHPESLSTFLAYKPDVNATDIEGNSALHMANSTNRAIMDALLAAGADVNLQNKSGDTPLHVARREKMIWLLDAGANLEARNHEGQTPLFKNITDVNSRQLLIKHGARLDTRDYNGRTLLHMCIEKATDTKTLVHLIDLGLDPTSVDYEGNTLLFELALKRPTLEISTLKYLLRLGLDIDQANNAGRTVLHTLCYYWSSKEQALEHALRFCKNLNPRDHDGIQPLHIAASVSEVPVFKLLNAGADLLGATNEGMTVLHLAAQACQPCVIGIVLSDIADLGEVTRKLFINQQDQKGNAALHHACRSGRPETVKALLEAGADPNLLNKDGNSPFRACVYFEAERKGHLDMAHETICLGEIFKMLILHGAVVNGDNGSLQSTFNAALSYQHEYTVDCLLSLPNRIPGVEPIKYSTTEDYLLCSHRLSLTTRTLRESGLFPKNNSILENLLADVDLNFAEKLVSLRCYDLSEKSLSEGFDLLRLREKRDYFLQYLVGFGYKDLLVRFFSHDALKLDDHHWCQLPAKDEETAPSGSRRRTFSQSLLLTACQRQLPNMDVCQFLVEEIGVDTNVQDGEHKGLSGSVLHSLAAGFNWWHVAQALPYLIKMGANIEPRDQKGRTPLHIALDSENGPFSQEAARILVENGADVNAADPKGKTCLSKAGRDLEMTKLLLNHGAKIDAVDLFEAIEHRQIKVLEELLSGGDNANLRISEPETTTARETSERLFKSKTIDNQIFPLLKASLGIIWLEKGRADIEESRRQVMALLNHGTDPYATIFNLLNVESADGESLKASQNSDSQKPGSTWVQETNIVFHEMFARGQVVEPLFHLPTLPLELRDSQGRTLLLAAFEGKTLGHKIDYGEGVTKTVLQELLDRGADVTAQDNDGKTILHRIKGLDPRTDAFKILKSLLDKNPILVHIADQAGDTALHYALRQPTFLCVNPPFFYGRTPDVGFLEYPELLLDYGADPLQPDHRGDTVLHHLAKSLRYSGLKDLFQRFLNAGVDINARNKKGETPLFYYVEEGPKTLDWIPWGGAYINDEWHDPYFDFFKDAGADFFVKNDEGTNLLHLLAFKKSDERGGSTEIVGRFKYLMKLGLDPMAEDAQQRTSLDVAAVYRRDDIIKLFKRKPME